ncbi:MAG: stage II sporulation protein M [Deltaproteobacteria bacterium]|nr:stage II sporulation protein M [Deltaproteobacteria bacterium]
MILDLKRFVEEGRPLWDELSARLELFSRNPDRAMSLEEIARFRYLYQRACADLSRLHAQSGEQGLKQYLESLVAAAYGEMYGSRPAPSAKKAAAWLAWAFPRAFRRRWRAFLLCLAVTLLGAVFGAGALTADPEAKAAIMPFPELLGDPSERVAREEEGPREEAKYAAFSSYLMTHNIRVSVFALALGMTFGVGTLAIEFYNGAILGAVAADYVRAGEGVFMAGWLLPHGSVEIPAFLIAAQAGLVLAGALLGRKAGVPLAARLRAAGGDLVALVFGAAALLVWAGVVESFFSQHHEPVIPYEAKILLGLFHLALLTWYLAAAGRREALP